MKQIKVKLTGLRPLIMHNGLMADPTNPYTVAIKKITAKGSKKMTIHDHQERDRLEWEAGLYWSEAEGGMVMPSDNIERCIQEGAKKSRLGKDFAAAVFVSGLHWRAYSYGGNVAAAAARVVAAAPEPAAR